MAMKSMHRDIDEEAILFKIEEIPPEISRKAMELCAQKAKSKEDLRHILSVIWPEVSL